MPVKGMRRTPPSSLAVKLTATEFDGLPDGVS